MIIKIIRAGIFLLILLLGIKLFIFPDNAFFVYKKMYQGNLRGIQDKEIHVLFLGDSHAAVFSQSMLNALTYNLSIGGDTTREMYLKILYALRVSHGLKYLFLQADPHVLCKYRFTAENKSFIKGVVPDPDFDLVYGTGPQKSIFQGFIDNVPIFSGDLYVLARKELLAKITRLFTKGEGIAESYAAKSPEEKKRDAAHRCEDHFSSGEDKDLAVYYQKIIGICQEHGIHVIGIRYPVSEEYLQAAQKLNWSGLVSQIDHLGFERVLDYSHFFTGPAYFENTDHINVKSARILLEQVHKDFMAVKI